jgi:uncharacterized protein YwqG
MDEDAKELSGFKWADEEVGKRHQLGGNPNFIQEEVYPVCHECNNSMSFYGQLDSIDDEHCIADCGMVYVFICFHCNLAQAFIQSY